MENMPRPRAVACHAACYSSRLCLRRPRACPVESHVDHYRSHRSVNLHGTSPCIQEKAFADVATTVKLHGTSPWHPSNLSAMAFPQWPFRNGLSAMAFPQWPFRNGMTESAERASPLFVLLSHPVCSARLFSSTPSYHFIAGTQENTLC